MVWLQDPSKRHVGWFSFPMQPVAWSRQQIISFQRYTHIHHANLKLTTFLIFQLSDCHRIDVEVGCICSTWIRRTNRQNKEVEMWNRMVFEIMFANIFNWGNVDLHENSWGWWIYRQGSWGIRIEMMPSRSLPIRKPIPFYIYGLFFNCQADPDVLVYHCNHVCPLKYVLILS